MSRFSGLVKLAAAAAVGATVAGGAVALAGQGSPHEAGFSSAHHPANIGEVKLDVLDYYGDRTDAEGKHHYSPDSRWAHDVDRAIGHAKRYLERRLDSGVDDPAIVLDVDDTSEVTFGWEADNDFGFDPDKQEDAINAGEFPAIPQTLELANWASQRGVDVYFLTGRGEHQKAASLKNLANEGYPAPAGAFFKPEETAPDYLPCGLDCETVEYKSGTRQHIESQGSTIVLNIGDQYSDLQGGHAERPVKLPNPMYYLP